ELRAGERLDDVEERDRIAHLVGLQRADEMKDEVGIFPAQRRKLALSLLDPVLAEDALAARERGLYRVCRIGLAHRDQRHALGGAAALLRRLPDPRSNGCEIAGDVRERHARIVLVIGCAANTS